MDDRWPAVLVIDDSVLDVEIARRAFQGEPGAEIIHAVHDTWEALGYLLACPDAGEHAPATPAAAHLRLILLDVHVPPAGGLDVLRRIKSHPTLRRIPVVMLSGSDDSHDMACCYDAGANSYLVKPVNYQEFRAAAQLLAPYWLRLNRLPAPAPPAASA